MKISMNVKKLSEMQKVLDERIVKEHGLEGKDLEENKILALLVEVNELANETRCFKHWSTKGPSEESVLFEEYVDSLHFFLSIANDISMISTGCINPIWKILNQVKEK